MREVRRLMLFENGVLRRISVADPAPEDRSCGNGTARLAVYSVPKASLTLRYRLIVT
jgi:hypothetical protein